MLYMLNEESIEMIRRELAKPGAVVKPRDDGMYAVYPGDGWPKWVETRANDHLTLSAAHRLLSVLADDTLSREVQAECRDVMANLEKMVADA